MIYESKSFSDHEVKVNETFLFRLFKRKGGEGDIPEFLKENFVIKKKERHVIAGFFLSDDLDRNQVMVYLSFRNLKSCTKSKEIYWVVSSFFSNEINDEKGVYAELLLFLLKKSLEREISCLFFLTDRINFYRFCQRFGIQGDIVVLEKAKNTLVDKMIVKLIPKKAMVNRLSSILNGEMSGY